MHSSHNFNNEENYTPLDDAIMDALIVEEVKSPSNKKLYYILGAFALVSILAVSVTLFMQMKNTENDVLAKENQTTRKAVENSDSLAVLGKKNDKPTHVPTRTLSITKTPSQAPTKTATPTPTQSPTKTPAPAATATATPTATPTSTTAPTATSAPTQTPTSTPTSAPTHTPTQTPVPTATIEAPTPTPTDISN